MPALDQLPRPSDTRIAVRVTPDAGRHIVANHPWVYDHSIVSESHEGAPGDLAVIFDRHRNFMAIGLYDPTSPIRIKVLHHGKPRQIDATFWRQQLAAAIARRAPLVERGDTTGYRVVNGENDGFPGLVVDRYSDVVVVKVYSPIWFAHLANVVAAIDEALHPTSVVLRLARALNQQPLHGLVEGDAIFGVAVTEPVRFEEHGLQFEADVVHGQKTGHFLDQRDNRQLLRERAKGARVLDVFASTGGFTVYAAAGGAKAVTSVDLSAPTLAVAARNLAHNIDLIPVRACTHEAIVGDAFEVMDRLIRQRATFDIVVVDPPSFAQRSSNVERALHAYAQLTERAVRLLVPDGMLVQASCSSRVTPEQFHAGVRAATQRTGHDLAEIRRTGHAIDHPVTFEQGGYLKAVFARVVPVQST